MGKYLTLDDTSGTYIDVTCDGFVFRLETDTGSNWAAVGIRNVANSSYHGYLYPGSIVIGGSTYTFEASTRTTTIKEDTPTRVILQVDGNFSALSDSSVEVLYYIYSDRVGIEVNWVTTASMSLNDSASNRIIATAFDGLSNIDSVRQNGSSELSGASSEQAGVDYTGFLSDELNVTLTDMYHTDDDDFSQFGVGTTSTIWYCRWNDNSTFPIGTHTMSVMCIIDSAERAPFTGYLDMQKVDAGTYDDDVTFYDTLTTSASSARVPDGIGSETIIYEGAGDDPVVTSAGMEWVGGKNELGLAILSADYISGTFATGCQGSIIFRYTPNFNNTPTTDIAYLMGQYAELGLRVTVTGELYFTVCGRAGTSTTLANWVNGQEYLIEVKWIVTHPSNYIILGWTYVDGVEVLTIDDSTATDYTLPTTIYVGQKDASDNEGAQGTLKDLYITSTAYPKQYNAARRLEQGIQYTNPSELDITTGTAVTSGAGVTHIAGAFHADGAYHIDPAGDDGDEAVLALGQIEHKPNFIISGFPLTTEGGENEIDIEDVDNFGAYFTGNSGADQLAYAHKDITGYISCSQSTGEAMEIPSTVNVTIVDMTNEDGFMGTDTCLRSTDDGNGDDRLYFPSTGIVSGTRGVISLWYRHRDTSGSQYAASLMGHTGATDAFRLRITADDNLYLYAPDGATVNSINIVNNIRDGEWHFVQYIYDTDIDLLEVQIDGVLYQDSSPASLTAFDTSSGNMVFGSHGGNNDCGGDICQIFISDNPNTPQIPCANGVPLSVPIVRND